MARTIWTGRAGATVVAVGLSFAALQGGTGLAAAPTECDTWPADPWTAISAALASRFGSPDVTDMVLTAAGVSRAVGVGDSAGHLPPRAAVAETVIAAGHPEALVDRVGEVTRIFLPGSVDRVPAAALDGAGEVWEWSTDPGADPLSTPGPVALDTCRVLATRLSLLNVPVLAVGIEPGGHIRAYISGAAPDTTVSTVTASPGVATLVGIPPEYDEGIAFRHRLPDGLEPTSLTADGHLGAIVTTGRTGEPALQLVPSPAGVAAIDTWAAAHPGDRVALVLDGIVIAAFAVADGVPESVLVEPQLTSEETTIVASILGSGPLTGPLAVVGKTPYTSR